MTMMKMMKMGPPKHKPNTPPPTLAANLNHIQDRIKKASLQAGRNSENITLVAITKRFPIEIWQQAYNNNLNIIGESRVQEAQTKHEQFINRESIKLHLIGHLQSNKVRTAVGLFDVIQTVDSFALAEKINYISREMDKTQQIYIQVNTGRDPNKHGTVPNQALSLARDISTLDKISLQGIMTMPPYGLKKASLRQIYRKTRKIRDQIQLKINNNCKYLSMGMSNDYEIAIVEGATHIRIGAGLFGARPQ